MAHKFKIGDLVTVVQKETVWYTHLDELRKSLLGKTGRIIDTESLIFTVEDMEFYKIPKPWNLLTVYSYRVIFPDMPEHQIYIDEVHLELFKLER